MCTACGRVHGTDDTLIDQCRSVNLFAKQYMVVFAIEMYHYSHCGNTVCLVRSVYISYIMNCIKWFWSPTVYF